MIMACYSVWNEEERLPLSIRSIERYVDKILIVDGRHKGFADELPVQSTDKTLEVARKFNKVEIIQCTESLEIYDKYNMFFTKDADWYIWLDCDEIIYGDIDKAVYMIKTRTDVPIWCIRTFISLERLYNNDFFFIPKVFSRSSGFRFVQEHVPYTDQNGVNLSLTAPALPTVCILGLTELRPELHSRRKAEYRVRQIKRGSWW
jgi:hypothetical protein